MPASFIFTFYSILILKNKIEFLEEFFFCGRKNSNVKHFSNDAFFSHSETVMQHVHTKE